jgi:hypothetical protein
VKSKLLDESFGLGSMLADHGKRALKTETPAVTRSSPPDSNDALVASERRLGP